ncbi:MAG TPA: pilus assembly protein TadG-related protein [Bryobacteraceae bacterium]|jgi:hypothetical protein|nr:pilus assembly protein TadG-related protein [Bryobacteraceae bacterium]
MNRRRSTRGQAAIMVSLSLVVTLGLLGMVVDVGWMYWRKEAAFTAAQAAAIGAVMQAKTVNSGSTFTCNSPSQIWCGSTATACSTSPTNSTTLGTACLYAKQNGFTASGRQNVLVSAGNGTAPTVPNVASSYYVTVQVTEQIPLTFLAVIANGYFGTVAARSTAEVINQGGGGCIYVLDPSGAAALNVSNGVRVSSQCGYYVDSSSSSALSVTGGANLTATNGSSIMVHGGAVVNNGATTSPAPTTGAPVAADPFLSRPVPWSSSASSRTYQCDYTGCDHTTCDHTNYTWSSWTSQLTLSPGVYCGGIQIGNVNSVVFNPGVYILNGGGMNLGGLGGIPGGVTGSNVLFFDTGTNSTYKGITLGNGISFTFSAPTTGSLAGILFYQDPGITAPTLGASAVTSYFNGGSSFSLQGSLYFPNTTVNFSNGTSTTATGLVVNDLVFTGGSNFVQDTSNLTGLGVVQTVAIVE